MMSRLNLFPDPEIVKAAGSGISNRFKTEQIRARQISATADFPGVST
jgi:hypothetical protein